jgi:hypothetical protein
MTTAPARAMSCPALWMTWDPGDFGARSHWCVLPEGHDGPHSCECCEELAR